MHNHMFRLILLCKLLEIAIVAKEDLDFLLCGELLSQRLEFLAP